ncbi:MAG: hypothetical protein AB1831_10545 [Pseudomonadota bacterium]
MALLLVVFIPALLVHFTLGRNGGHHLFKNVPKEKIRDLPYEMMRSRIRRDLRSSFATLVGLCVALVLYPLGCRLGLPINFLGLSDQALVFYVTVGVGLLILIGYSIRGRGRK